MKHSIRTVGSAALLLFAAAGLHTVHAAGAVRDAAQTAASAASGVANKVERGVKRGATATGDAVERGVRAANRGADKVAAKVGISASGPDGKRIRQPEAKPGVRPTDPSSTRPPD